VAPPILQSISTQLRERGHARVGGGVGTLPCMVLPQLAEGRPLLWLCADDDVAERRHEALRFALADADKAAPDAHDRRVALYPDWDVDPYSGLSPHSEITRRRLEVLAALAEKRPWVVVAPATALLKRVLPRAGLNASQDWLVVEEDCDREGLLRTLSQGGYLRVDRVEDRGTFAARGHVIDFYPPGSGQPVRIELWGDTVDSIRHFEPISQRSSERLEEVVVLPVHEVLLAERNLDRVSHALEALARERGVDDKQRIELGLQFRRGYNFAGRDEYLPLFFEGLDTIFDYLGPEALVVREDTAALERRIRDRAELVLGNFEENHRRDAMVPEPSALYLEAEDLLAGLDRFERVDLADPETTDGSFDTEDGALPALRQRLEAERRNPDGMLEPFVKRLRQWSEAGLCRVVAARTRSSMRSLAELLRHRGVELVTHPYAVPAWQLLDEASHIRRGTEHLHLLQTSPGEGFVWPAGGLVVVAEEDLFGRRVRRVRHSVQRGRPLASLEQLKAGDLVVHSLHGVGRFLGLTRIDAGGTERDVVLLEYRGEDRLYLPIHRLDLLKRHSGPSRSDASLDKLGGQTFTRRKNKARESVQRLARELLEIYARRAEARGVSFSPADDLFREFEQGFEYVETPDQREATDAILDDMRKAQPMDRVLCGEVGFGKTEVAMRAAFKAVLDKKQVAILVPTTVLAMQHHRSFHQRMGPWGVMVESVSRLVPAKKQKEVLERLAAGKVDVLIGTHRLLSDDVAWKDLGLLVIDEEHRFGIKDKETIKKMRAGIDLLAMSATPIPRTLNLALFGLREFSMIETPPPGRKAVRTFVVPFAIERIRKALEFELQRGGQAYVVHNRIQSIDHIADMIERAVPGVDLRVAHGQMRPRQLEDIMLDFMQWRFQVLVCTTIIESGVDVPTANTLVVSRADRYGLAELHQLRGRVGRADQRGYCYLMTPPDKRLPDDAERRLQALQENQHLGAGFRIAQEDLEIRGAGEVLGRDQSGHMEAIGVETYLEMLAEAVAELRGRPADGGPELDLDVDLGAYIPGGYVSDPTERLHFYRRFVSCEDTGAALTVLEEVEDLYGPPPEEVNRFYGVAELRGMARSLWVESVSKKGRNLLLRFHPESRADPGGLSKTDLPHRWTPAGELSLSSPKGSSEGPMSLLRRSLRALGADVRQTPR
jgi:transcription-repair coupling factor (superfamily II helicase)